MAEKTVQIRCGDGRAIELDDATAFMSESIKSWVTSARKHRNWHRVIYKLTGGDRLSRIPSPLVEKVFQYCERHAHAQADDDLHAFDAQFCCDLDPYELCKLSMVALWFEVPSLQMLSTGHAYTAMSRHMTLKEVISQYHRYTLSVLEEFPETRV